MKINRRVSFLGVLVSCVALFSGCSSERSKEKTSCYRPIVEVDFDNSLGKSVNDFRYILLHGEDSRRYTVLRGLYEKNLPSKLAPVKDAKIPKIIHQIWLGPNLPPPCFSGFQEKWKAIHPDWEYHLWTEEELEGLNLGLRDLIDSSPNYAEKSDIIRAELLDRFGGVYLDVDMEPWHSLDELHHKYDFYAGIDYPHKVATTNCRLWLGLSVVAACPHHPIIVRWKELVHSRWEEVNKTHSGQVDRVLNHTYFPFSLAFFEKCNSGHFSNIVFPPTYFGPLSSTYAAKRGGGFRSFREKCYDILEDMKLRRPRAFSRICPETLAVHYWGGSWYPGWGDQVKDLQYHIDFLRKELYRLQHKVFAMEKSTHQDQTRIVAGGGSEDNESGEGAEPLCSATNEKKSILSGNVRTSEITAL